MGGRLQRIALLLGVLPVTYLGYRLFHFFTDDAFIAFRYVSNHRLGHGFVWNPPPFGPVEGYTSWLWVALLDLVWTTTGVAPPDSANRLSLLFGYATLFVGYRFVMRMPLPDGLARHRTALLGLVFLGTVTNRTFLTWLSSGLETSLFNFAITLWLYHATTARGGRGRGWIAWVSTSATLCALTRPDGLLIVVATAVLLAFELTRQGTRSRLGPWWPAYAAPLLGTLAHLLWRRWTYGEWLPNTYYAKYTSPWPASGWRYALSFVLEYGLWIWIVVAALALWRKRGPDRSSIVAVGFAAAHVAYYTFVIGGDHFEYRVYSHLVLLLFVSFLWMLARLELNAGTAFVLFAVFIVSSWPLPWLHYASTRDLHTRRETMGLFRPVAPRFPTPLRFYPRAFDTLQSWLIERSVCLRHQEHKAFHQFLARGLPSREQGSRISWDERPVLSATGVGVSGWILPHVAIIDILGLNDHVIARTPIVRRERRVMAHDRRPPPGYVRCFKPNVALRMSKPDLPEGAPLLRVRPRILTDADIVACENRFRRKSE